MLLYAVMYQQKRLLHRSGARRRGAECLRVADVLLTCFLRVATYLGWQAATGGRMKRKAAILTSERDEGSAAAAGAKARGHEDAECDPAADKR